MDNILLLSILLVFLAALVGSVLQHRRVDRVLKNLQGFQVTLQLTEKRIWGRFKLYANALELLFGSPYTNRRGNKLSSYIVFNEQIEDIEAIFRFHDELTSEHQTRRLAEIEKAKNPGLMSRVKRSLRNFLVAFREAIDESIGLLLSRVQKKAGSSLLKGQEGYLKKLGSNTVGIVSTSAFDPVLENYINKQVVLEAGKIDGKRVEYVGVLNEYSSGWISLLDCHISAEIKLPLDDSEQTKTQQIVDFIITTSEKSDDANKALMQIKIKNRGAEDLTIVRIEDAENWLLEIEELLKPEESTSIQLKDFPPESISHSKPENLSNLTLVLETVRDVDIYIPRSRALLRHASPNIS